LAPKVRIYVVEIETAAPLAAGRPTAVEYRQSFVDRIEAKGVFPRMFELARTLPDGSPVVTLREAAQALKLVAERNHVIAERASACAVAEPLSGRTSAMTFSVSMHHPLLSDLIGNL
jgi:threonine dehydratase